MNDDEMKQFFPSYGDRIAISDFVKRTLSTNQKRRSLLHRLRSKYENKEKKKKQNLSSEDEDENLVTGSSKHVAETSTSFAKRRRTERFVEIGWLHRNNNGEGFKQVRFRKGGGSRKIKVPVSFTKLELLEEAKKLFFPGGKSAKVLELQKLFADLLDFSGNTIDVNITVNSFFENAKVSKLRVYLSTKLKCETVTSDECNRNTIVPDASLVSTSLQSATSLCHEVLLDELGNTLVPSDNMNALTPVYQGLNRRGELYTLENMEESGLSEFITITQENSELLEQNDSDFYVRKMTEPSIHIKLHRGQIFEELIALFSECDLSNQGIYVQVVLPNGDFESAEDLGGVWRDALSEFWGTMIEK